MRQLFFPPNCTNICFPLSNIASNVHYEPNFNRVRFFFAVNCSAFATEVCCVPFVSLFLPLSSLCTSAQHLCIWLNGFVIRAHFDVRKWMDSSGFFQAHTIKEVRWRIFLLNSSFQKPFSISRNQDFDWICVSWCCYNNIEWRQLIFTLVGRQELIRHLL